MHRGMNHGRATFHGFAVNMFQVTLVLQITTSNQQNNLAMTVMMIETDHRDLPLLNHNRVLQPQLESVLPPLPRSAAFC
jgi:hypothetical protein